MAATECEKSRCGLCRFYRHEGRRGGMCSQLNVPVSAHLDACCLAASPFDSELNGEPDGSMGIAKREASRFVANDTILTAKTPSKVRAVSAA